MTFKSSGTFVRSSASSSSEPGGTQVYALPPRPSEAGARPLSSPSAAPVAAVPVAAVPVAAVPVAAVPSVSVLATIGVGGAAPPGVPPRPVGRATSARLVNEPTRIFAMPSLPGASEAKSSEGVGRRTAPFASPPFSPVPNAKVVARSAAKSGDASRPAAPEVKTARAPLLRAFDDARKPVATWWTATTVSAPLSQLVEREASNDDRAQRLVVAAAPKRSRATSARRRLSARVVAVVTVVIAGGVVVRGVSNVVGRRSGSSSAAVSASGVGGAAHEAPVAAPRPGAATAPNATPVAPGSTGRVAVVPNTVVAPPAITAVTAAPATATRAEVARDRSSTPGDGSASPGVTLARQAVDALLAGDRATALLHYRELSRSAPAHDAYREAVRLLDPSASTPPLDMPR